MFSVHQNLKYSRADSYSLSVYGAGLLDANFDGTPDDYRTVNRYNFLYDEKVKQLAVDTRVEIEADTGAVHHTALVGLDYRNLQNVSDFGFAGRSADRPVQPGQHPDHRQAGGVRLPGPGAEADRALRPGRDEGRQPADHAQRPSGLAG
jgi:outer membrane receptor protein involved in Fe transport